MNRRVVTVALLLTIGLAGLAGPARAQAVTEWGLPQLMGWMRQVPEARARFVETRQVQLLNQPLQSSGTLIYVAPDRLDKRTLAPAPSRLSVQGDRLTYESPDGGAREIALSDHPEIGALVAGIRATLAGDLATLTGAYAATLTGSPFGWFLTLQPRDPHLRELVTRIRIEGEQNRITAIETEEANGDRSVMTILAEPG